MQETATTLIIEGAVNRHLVPLLSPELQELIGTPRLLEAYDLQPPVRGEAVPETRVEVLEDDLLELQLEGGFTLLMTVADYRQQFGEPLKRGAVDDGSMRISANLPGRSRDRGLLKWIVKGLKVIGVDLAKLAAQKLAAHIDTKKGLNGLYRCPLAASRLSLGANPVFPQGNEPLLLFIHGTMSSTEGSFGGLWSDQAAVRTRLATRYGERCYAFEHKTFTESPIQNTLALVQALPANARLHLVSHSRGGMIGELLCRASRIDTSGTALPSFDADDFCLFSSPTMTERLKELHALDDALKQKNLRVERFVRVACPARGTSLASGRLERFLSVMNFGLSALGLPGWLSDLSWFVAAVAKERTDPKVMPGIEAMMPGSATVTLLNRTGVELASDLRVIAGDYNGGGIIGTVGDWALEEFFKSENDIVVNTPSMYGGSARLSADKKPNGWYFFAAGPQIYHFNYFKVYLTAAKLADGLLQDDPRSAGFQPLSQAPHADEPIARGAAFSLISESFGDKLLNRLPTDGGNRPILVMVPGIMGTHLQEKNNRIWLDMASIVTGSFDKLKTEQPEVTTDGLLKMTYGRFAEYMASSHEVLFYPYDWRLSLLTEGGSFARYMDQVLTVAAKNNRPVRIIAHSMGGLLVRMAAVLSSSAQQGNGWWHRFVALSGNRLVMAGTPNNGSWVVPFVLTGRDSVIKMLDIFDLQHSRKELLDIVNRFTGFLEMLPWHGENSNPCFDGETWKQWRMRDKEEWAPPDATLLAACRENRKLLDQFDFTTHAGTIRYVAGCDDHTPSGIDENADSFRFTSSPRGDGRVLWDTGIPKGVKTWYVMAKHGDIVNHRDSFDGLQEIINIGETTLLSDRQPSERGAASQDGLMPEQRVPYYPDEAMLVRAAAGGEITPPRCRSMAEGAAPFRVVVCHGDLSAARYPVLVGHYVGDTINGSEAVLDQRLEQQLSRRHKLGIYPGAEGTTEIFRSQTGNYAALVIGLGQVGELTPARLADGVTRALLEFATTPRFHQGSEDDGFSVSAILVGSAAGWGLGVKDSVRALIEGAERANSVLSELDTGYNRLVELEILEIYEDRALQALRAVRELAALGSLGNIRYEVNLRIGTDGRCRAMSENNSDWWQRVKVEITPDDALKFTSMTGLARIEETVQPTQRALVDSLLEDAVREARIPTETMVALYNLVTPEALKQRTPDRGDLLMMLDRRAAGYPWEMMYVLDNGKKVPLALRAGLIRQLSLDSYRQRPAYGSALRALVIADPDLGRGNGGGLQQLGGALSEGMEVASVFDQHGFEAVRRLGSSAVDIVSALFDGDYRVLHLAGHGLYRQPIATLRETTETLPYRNEEQSGCIGTRQFITGMVLDWKPGKTPVLLTAVEVRQMNVVPELVFINCCFLGKLDDKTPVSNRHLFAAGLAAEFIAMGVKAVVAAGWAVDDTAAAAFASAFYRAMFDGHTFGEATRTARMAARDAVSPDFNTWAAYQCYGDPAYRFRDDHVQTSRKIFLSPREALCELQAMRDKKHNDIGNRLNCDELRKELQQIESLIPHDWMVANGALRCALGAAYGEMGDSMTAIEHYKAATTCNDGSCALRALEQQFNLRVRQAGKGSMSPEAAADTITDEIKKFSALMDEIGETKERCCLLGSAYKRLAMLQQKGGVDAIKLGTIEKMATWYGKAMELDKTDPYPALNWAMGQLVLSSNGVPVDKHKLREVIEKAGQNGTAMNAANPGFWNGIHAIDADVMLLLLDTTEQDSYETSVDKLVRRYKQQFADYGSANGIDSVRTQFDFYLQFAAEDALKMKIQDLLAKLN